MAIFDAGEIPSRQGLILACVHVGVPVFECRASRIGPRQNSVHHSAHPDRLRSQKQGSESNTETQTEIGTAKRAIRSLPPTKIAANSRGRSYFQGPKFLARATHARWHPCHICSWAPPFGQSASGNRVFRRGSGCRQASTLIHRYNQVTRLWSSMPRP